MDWGKLKSFHAAAEAGSLTSAGERLGISQSAVSRQIAALEEALGALERTRDDNEHTLRDAKAALGEADYGPDGARWALRGTCVEKTLPGYVYEVCSHKNVRQDPTPRGDYPSTTGRPRTHAAGHHARPTS